MNAMLGERVLKILHYCMKLTFEYVMGPEKKEITAITIKFVQPKMSVIVSNLHVAAIANPVICMYIYLRVDVQAYNGLKITEKGFTFLREKQTLQLAEYHKIEKTTVPKKVKRIFPSLMWSMPAKQRKPCLKRCD